MIYLRVAGTSVLSILALLVLTRLLGYRQMSRLSLFDYINGITIGSIAAEAASMQNDDFLRPFIAMVVYTAATLAFSTLTDKSLRARRLLAGEPIILYRNGVFFDRNFRRAHLDINEFQMQCRSAGYFDMAQLSLALLEPNGALSLLPHSAQRPLTPADMHIDTAQEPLPANVILDGQIMEKNLLSTGRARDWLERQLQSQNLKAQKVFLATLTADGQLKTYRRGGEAGHDTLG